MCIVIVHLHVTYIFYAALITNEYNFNDKIKYLNIWDLDYWKVLLVTIFTLFNPCLIKKNSTNIIVFYNMAQCECMLFVFAGSSVLVFSSNFTLELLPLWKWINIPNFFQVPNHQTPSAQCYHTSQGNLFRLNSYTRILNCK